MGKSDLSTYSSRRSWLFIW